MAKCPDDETIIVVNPNTGKKINLAPLFKYFEENRDLSQGTFEVMLETVDSVLRFICIEARLDAADPRETSKVFYDLYNLKDALSKISEFN